MKIYAGKKSVAGSTNAHKQKPVMAGAGAGYRVEWEIVGVQSVNSISAANITDNEDGFGYDVEIDCDVTVDITIKGASSYMYGFSEPIESVTAEITHMYFDGVPDPEYFNNLTTDDLENHFYEFDILNADWISNLGGGWSHSTFNGKLASAEDSSMITDGFDGWTVSIVDDNVVNYIDRCVSGKCETYTFGLFTYDGDFIDSYEDVESAREAAQQLIDSGAYSFIECVRQTDFERYNGDIDYLDSVTEFTLESE